MEPNNPSQNSSMRKPKRDTTSPKQAKTGWWFGTCFMCPLGIIISTDFHIFQRGRYNTTNQKISGTIYIIIYVSCLFFGYRNLWPLMGNFGLDSSVWFHIVETHRESCHILIPTLIKDFHQKTT